MPSTPYAGRARFGLLPEPERNPASILTSFAINGGILVLLLVLGTYAHHEIQVRKMESLSLIHISEPTRPY